MRSGLVVVLQMLLMLPALVSCFTEEEVSSGQADIITVGQKLPDFSVKMDDGTQVSPASLSGKPAVIVFFHTGCSDCRKELPVVQRVYDECSSQASFVCISRAEDEVAVAAYWRAEKLSLPYSAQPDKTVYQKFARQTIPRIYVADAAGIVRSVFVEQASYKRLSEAVKEVSSGLESE